MWIGRPAIHSCDGYKGSPSFNFECGGYLIQLTERPGGHSKSNPFQPDTVFVPQQHNNLKKFCGIRVQFAPNRGGFFGP